MRSLRGAWSSRETTTTYLLLAAWFGILIGLSEVLLLGIKKYALHHILLLSPHVIWMAPVADVVILAIPALFLSVLARRWPRVASIRVAIFCFSFLGYVSLFFMYALIHRLALAVLAAGFAWQTMRFVTARYDKFLALVRLTIGWMAALVAVLAVGMAVINP